MSLDVAQKQALADLPRIAPFVAAAKSGCAFEHGKFTVPFFNRRFAVRFPEGLVEEVGQTAPPPQIVQVVVLHYLLSADGTQVADEWINYRQLPGAHLTGYRFDSLALNALLEAFGHDIEGFRRACDNLGGVPMGRTGDASFRFLAFPKMPMACILYLGDDEMAPSMNILFDASAPHYLPTEDISFLGSYLASSLSRQKRNLTK